MKVLGSTTGRPQRLALASWVSLVSACSHQPPIPPERPFDRLQTACEAGDAQSCAELGYEFEHERTWRFEEADRDSFRAYERACELGHARSCYIIAPCVELGLVGAPTADPERALALLEQSCDLGEVLACNELASRYMTSLYGVESPEKELRARERACKLGAWPSCDLVLYTYLDAPTFDWPAIDEVLGLIACDDPTSACDRLRGLALLHIIDIPPRGQAVEVTVARRAEREAHARELVARGCENQEPRACLDLAGMLAAGVGGPRDVERGLAMFDRECEAGEADGCWSAGRFRVEAPEVRDLKLARERFDQACTAQDAEPARECKLVAAEIFAAGEAKQYATALFEPLCEGGDAEACVRWGRTLAETPRSYKQAVELFRGACDAGEASGCARLARMMALGRGTKKDPAAAEALALQACRDGALEACGPSESTLLRELGRGAKDIARLTAAIGLFPVWQLVVGDWW